jgi:ketosteroid isomerase-like protein
MSSTHTERVTMSKSYTAILALILIAGATHVLPAQAPTSVRLPAEEHAQDKVAIEKVMAEFHAAVGAHDGVHVTSLSVSEGSTWFNVLSDQAFAAAKLKNPAVRKVRHSSFAEFAKFVSTTAATLNPQHTDIHIHTDGTIASVYFDFVFLIDGKAQNRGAETWQLLKTEEGWKIAAITYSSNPSA